MEQSEEKPLDKMNPETEQTEESKQDVAADTGMNPFLAD